MKLLTHPMIEKLAQNGHANAERLADDGDTIDHFPGGQALHARRGRQPGS